MFEVHSVPSMEERERVILLDEKSRTGEARQKLPPQMQGRVQNGSLRVQGFFMGNEAFPSMVKVLIMVSLNCVNHQEHES